jgi:demethylmenaquinone methyltransferase/2-methoxy-6-polyprenyl-1,4-benzoquinol methylase
MTRVSAQISTPDGKRRYVRALFARIADRYDLITRVLSYGQDRRWKRRLVGLAGPRPGTRALDLATGTGDIAFALAARGAHVVGLDVTFRMIELAERKAMDASTGRAFLANGSRPRFLVGDMTALPFPAASFDIVTTGYGLRNVPDLTAAVREIGRVLKPGGCMLSLDFNRPTNRAVRLAYLAYLSTVGGALGWILHRDPDTYRYIPASIRHYPGAEGVTGLMTQYGFDAARHYRVLGGLMAIHYGQRRAG